MLANIVEPPAAPGYSANIEHGQHDTLDIERGIHGLPDLIDGLEKLAQAL